MPTLDVVKEVYTFDELSDEAKEKAREWMRELEATDFDPCYEPYETAAGILGIEFDYSGRREPDIRWSGFCSQGSGASFVGSYSHAADSPAKIRAEFTTETRLHEIADILTALQVGYRLECGHWIHARITQSGRGVHEMTMDITATDSETGDEFDYDGEHVKIITEAMRDFARWIYESLEQEYDYRQSDEAIDETIRANEYEFDEDGELV